MIGLLLREALSRLRVRLNMYLVILLLLLLSILLLKSLGRYSGVRNDCVSQVVWPSLVQFYQAVHHRVILQPG